MSLSAAELRALATPALSAARAAGALIASQPAAGLSRTAKSGGTSAASQVVTALDIEAQRLIVATLAPTRERFELGLLAEESTDDGSRLVERAFWCVDPLDGTLPCLEERPGYAVSLALVSRAGVPLLGVVVDPTSGVAYHAVRGQGAFRDGDVWTLDPPAPRARGVPTVFVSRSTRQMESWSRAVDALTHLVRAGGLDEPRVIPGRGAVMSAIGVLLHAGPAVYVSPPREVPSGPSVWDFAATAALFDELGATATDVFGAPLDLNRADSTFMNHRGAIFSTDPHLADWAADQWPRGHADR